MSNTQTKSGGAIPSIKLRRCVQLKKQRLPCFLIVRKGLGKKLDNVALDFVQALRRSQQNGTNYIGLAQEAVQDQGMDRTLRIAHVFKKRHTLAVDVQFRAQGNDLFVRYSLRAKTLVANAMMAAFAISFCLIWLALTSVFFLTTDLTSTLGTAFAQKYYTDKDAGVAVMVSGWDVADPRTGSPYKKVKPWTLPEYFRLDPPLFIQSVGVLLGLTASVAFSLIMLTPENLKINLLRRIGWPTPDEFESVVISHRTWVQHELNNMLNCKYNVTQADIVEEQR